MLENQANEIDLHEDRYANLSVRELIFQLRITRATLDKIKKIYSRQFLTLQESFINETSRLRGKLVDLEAEVSRVHIAQLELAKRKSEGE